MNFTKRLAILAMILKIFFKNLKHITTYQFFFQIEPYLSVKNEWLPQFCFWISIALTNSDFRFISRVKTPLNKKAPSRNTQNVCAVAKKVTFDP